MYYPNTLKNSVNEKGNDVYKLDQMAPLNGIEHGDAHSAIGDVIATIGIAKLISKKAPNVWKASMLTFDKNQSLELCKKNYFFVQMNIFMEEADHMFKRLFVSILNINGHYVLI